MSAEIEWNEDSIPAWLEFHRAVDAEEHPTGEPVTLGGRACCGSCEEAVLRPFRETEPMRYLARFMHVCPDCQSKRCPKAAWHSYPCREWRRP